MILNIWLYLSVLSALKSFLVKINNIWINTEKNTTNIKKNYQKEEIRNGRNSR